jgi:predicted small lipoprotein YifL
MQNLIKTLFKVAVIFLIIITLNSCGGGLKLPKAGDARKMEVEGRERARKNIEEGR